MFSELAINGTLSLLSLGKTARDGEKERDKLERRKSRPVRRDHFVALS